MAKNKITIITKEILQGKTGYNDLIRDSLLKLEGKRAKIIIEEYSPARSNNQNSYYYGVVIPAVIHIFYTCGEIISPEEAHYFCKSEIGKLYICASVSTRDDITAKQEVMVLRSTASLTLAEFAEYITLIKAWAAEQGFDIPDPDSLMRNGGAFAG